MLHAIIHVHEYSGGSDEVCGILHMYKDCDEGKLQF